MGKIQLCVQQPNGDKTEENRIVTSSNRRAPPDPLSISEELWGIAEQTTCQEVLTCIHATRDSEELRKDVIDYVQRLIRCSIGVEWRQASEVLLAELGVVINNYLACMVGVFCPIIESMTRLQKVVVTRLQKVVYAKPLALLQNLTHLAVGFRYHLAESVTHNFELSVRGVFPYGSVPLKTYLPDGDIDLTALTGPNMKDTLPCDVLGVLQREQTNENAEFEVRDTQFIDAEVKLVKCLVQDIVIDISFNQLGGISTLCFLEQVVGGPRGMVLRVDRLVCKEHLFKRSIILIKAWCYYESRILGAHHGLISTYALESLILHIFYLFNSTLNGPLAVLYRFLDYYSKFDWENYCISLNGPVCKSSLPDIVVKDPGNGGAGLMFDKEFLKNCMDMFSVSSTALETDSRAFPIKYLNIIDPLKENNNLGRSVHKGNFYRIRSAFKYGARKLGRILLLPREKNSDKIKNFFESTLERHGRKSSALIFGGGIGSLSSLYSNTDIHLNSFSGNIDDDTLAMEGEISSGFIYELDRYSMKASPSQMGLETSCCHEGTVVSGYPLEVDVSDPATFRSLHLRCTNETFHCSPPRREINDSCLTDCNAACLCTNNHDDMSLNDSVISCPKDNISDSLSIDFRESTLASIIGDIETLNLSDLSGDYDGHVRSLLYGQCCHGYAISPPVLSNLPSSPPLFQNKQWDTFRPYVPLKLQMSTNGTVLGPLYPANSPTPSTAAFGLDERHKARGTGTYIPYMDCSSFWERPSQGRGTNQPQETHSQLQKHTLNNVLDPTLPGINSFKGGGHELTQAQSIVLQSGKPDSYHQPMHVLLGNPHGNGIQTLEFGSFGPLPEGNSHLALGNSNAKASTSSLAELDVQNSEQVKGKKQGRIVEKSLNLENKDDFPPVSF